MNWTRIALVATLATLLGAGETPRAQQEARAMQAVLALPDGPRREAGLNIVRQAWQAFRDDAVAATQPVPDDATVERTARLNDLAQRNASLAILLRMADRRGDQALADLADQHLQRWPLDDEVHAMRGLAQLRAGKRDEALNSLLAALTLHPGLPAARELRGRLTVDDTDPAVAATAAQDLAPLLAQLLDAGCTAVVEGQPAAAQRALDAIEPLARAVREAPATGKLAMLRAAVAESTEDWPRALEQWQLAAAAGVEQPPPAPRVRALIRRLHAAEVDPAIASGDVAQLRRLSPAFPERDDLQDRLFRLLLTRGQLAQVHEAARELLAADAAHPLALLMADGAAAALDPRRLELLPPFIARLRASAPTLGQRFLVVYGLDAALTEASGDVAGAALALAPLLAAQPDDREARWQHARLLQAAGDTAGALQDCDLLLNGHPDDVDTLALRGRVKAAAGDATGALADAERIVALRPGTSSLLARARIRALLDDQAGVLADITAMVQAAQNISDVAALLEAADLADSLKNEALLRTVLEKASQLGGVDATMRLRRMRR